MGLAIRPFLLCETVICVERNGVPLLRLSIDAYHACSPGSSGSGESGAAGQGVLMVLRQSWESLPRPIPTDLWIGVESIRTSDNLGTFLRAADAASATGLIVFDRSEAGTLMLYEAHRQRHPP